jgi:hypothetical protein
LALSVTETVLYYVVIPLGAALIISGLAVAGSGRSAKRYRPGRSYDFTPVWFLSAPDQLAGTGSADDRSAAALGSGRHRAELTTGAEIEKAGAASPAGTTGGASDRW